MVPVVVPGATSNEQLPDSAFANHVEETVLRTLVEGRDKRALLETLGESMNRTTATCGWHSRAARAATG